MNGRPMTIVGVAPSGFDGTTVGNQAKIFVPITMRAVLEFRDSTAFDNRRSYWAYLFGRLKPGVSIDSARAAIGPAYRAIVNNVEGRFRRA